MSYVADPQVDAYVAALPLWQQEICREVRELVHAADPEVVETIKRTRQPYFVLKALNRPALLAMFKQIIANNRGGGWRKLKGTS